MSKAETMELSIDEYAKKSMVRENFWGMRRLYFPLWRCVLGFCFDCALNLSEEIKYFFRVRNIYDHNKLRTYQYLWSRLTLDDDKRLLYKVVACRILGNKHVYFKDNVNSFATLYKKLKLGGCYFDRADFISKAHVQFKDVLGNGFSACLEMDLCTLGSIVCHQYRHPCIHPVAGDYCIDFGAFMGETALLIADIVGESGKVFAVEFGEKVVALQNNIEQNPQLKQRIQVIAQPFWSAANKKVYVTGKGVMAKISFDQPEGERGREYETLTLDEACNKHSIKKLDFIKMDVEGAECAILQGCTNTIKRFKPKLAISVYHSDEDFDRIPRFIDSLGCNYEFSIGHYSPTWAETVLYAKVKEKL